MMTIDPVFEKYLGKKALEKLNSHGGTIFGLFSDFRLAYMNDGWFVFAGENNGEPAITNNWPLGTRVTEAYPKSIRPFYEKMYCESMEQLQPRDHIYECSSSRLFRKFKQKIFPLKEKSGLYVVNSIVVEQPHDPTERQAVDPEQSYYIDENGILHQCCHCRMIRNLTKEGQWDWVPYWLDNPYPDTSHDICQACYVHYYGEYL